MPTQPIGKVIYTQLTEDDDVEAIVGNSVFPEGAVPTDTEPPYIEYAVIRNKPDRTLEGTSEGYDAQVTVRVTAESYEDCQGLVNACVSALDVMSGTIASIAVSASEVGDVSDEPNGPIDVDDAQVYQSEIPVSIYYTD